MKQYRFFYHFYKQKGKMSIHFRKSCTVIDNVICNVPCETKWKTSQPKLVMQGFCKSIVFKDNKAIIN